MCGGGTVSDDDNNVLANVGDTANIISWLTAAGLVSATTPVGLVGVLLVTLSVLGLKLGKRKFKERLDQSTLDPKMQEAFVAAWKQATTRYRQQGRDHEVADLFDKWLAPLDPSQQEELQRQLAKEPATAMFASEQIITARLRARASSTIASDEQRTAEAGRSFIKHLLEVLCEQPQFSVLRDVQIYINARETNRKLDTLLAHHDIANQPSRFISLTPDYIYTHPAPPKEEHIWLPTATPQ